MWASTKSETNQDETKLKQWRNETVRVVIRFPLDAALTEKLSHRTCSQLRLFSNFPYFQIEKPNWNKHEKLLQSQQRNENGGCKGTMGGMTMGKSFSCFFFIFRYDGRGGERYIFPLSNDNVVFHVFPSPLLSPNGKIGKKSLRKLRRTKLSTLIKNIFFLPFGWARQVSLRSSYRVERARHPFARNVIGIN